MLFIRSFRAFNAFCLEQRERERENKQSLEDKQLVNEDERKDSRSLVAASLVVRRGHGKQTFVDQHRQLRDRE